MGSVWNGQNDQGIKGENDNGGSGEKIVKL